MTLPAIGLMSLAALGVWLFRGQRPAALLIMSVVALYLLQPAIPALEIALPTATLLLLIGVWWLITPQMTGQDRKLLLLIGGLVCLMSMLLLGRPAFGQSVRGLPPILALSVGVIGAGAVIPKRDDVARRRIALAFIGLIVILLIVLKLPALQGTVTGIITPTLAPDWQWLGFSYIAFRLMHMLLDFRSGRLAPVSLQDFALYVIFFPALPAGPIDRVEHFVRELAEPASTDRIAEGTIRIGMGLFKKFILADTLASMALSPQLVAETNRSLPWTMWLMLYAYAFRIFFDFAGYSDIAIGIALLAGIKLPENFTAPYGKRNITAFWNSWHITLSTWFRNYFFTPFSRALIATRLRNHRLLIILIAQVSTMILIGLWHGIALNFVLWGLWHGLGLWFHRWLTERTHSWDNYVHTRPRLASGINILSVLATFHFVALGWIFFALPDLNLIGKAFVGLVGFHG